MSEEVQLRKENKLDIEAIRFPYSKSLLPLFAWNTTATIFFFSSSSSSILSSLRGTVSAWTPILNNAVDPHLLYFAASRTCFSIPNDLLHFTRWRENSYSSFSRPNSRGTMLPSNPNCGNRETERFKLDDRFEFELIGKRVVNIRASFVQLSYLVIRRGNRNAYSTLRESCYVLFHCQPGIKSFEIAFCVEKHSPAGKKCRSVDPLSDQPAK